MKNYRHSLPPLDSLIYFEAAARHLNFSDAAVELQVTQAAVSKRIRQLEDHLGVALFLRSGRVIDLTEEGNKLAQRSAVLLDFANNTLADIAAHPDAPTRIAANSAVSLFWLTPRLKKFSLLDQACPVTFVSSDQSDVLHDSQNDIAILHGSGIWKGRVAIPLFPDLLAPIISPVLAERLGLQSGQSLSQVDVDKRPPLLTFPQTTSDWTSWNKWGSSENVHGWQQTDCSTYAQSIGAALEGRGIALANPHILAAELEAGQLMKLVPEAQSKSQAYYLTFKVGRSPRRNTKRLINYLSREKV